MRKVIVAVLSGTLLATPSASPATELGLELAAGATAPLTQVLRKAAAGADVAVQLTYGLTPYLDLGLRYGLGVFPQDAVDARGNELEPIFDHGASALLRLTLAAGGDAGWLEAPGSMGGDLWLDLAVGYHMIGRESCAGLDVALGYALHVAPDWRLGPLFRVVNVFATSEGTASYVVFGLSFGYDFGGLIDGPAAPEATGPPPLVPTAEPAAAPPATARR